MKNALVTIFFKLVNRNIHSEVNSVCLGLGYQPFMPDSAKEFKYKKKK